MGKLMNSSKNDAKPNILLKFASKFRIVYEVVICNTHNPHRGKTLLHPSVASIDEF